MVDLSAKSQDRFFGISAVREFQHRTGPLPAINTLFPGVLVVSEELGVRCGLVFHDCKTSFLKTSALDH
jgi:hypothetical protein